MHTDSEISRHYSRGDLLSRLNAALLEDDVDMANSSRGISEARIVPVEILALKRR